MSSLSWSVIMRVPNGNLVLQNMYVNAKQFVASVPQGVVSFLAGYDTSSSTSMTRGGSMFWQSMRQTSESHVVHRANRLDEAEAITIDAQSVVFQEVETHAQGWMKRIQKVNPSCDILHEVVRDMHDVQTKKQQGFSGLFTW